MAWSLAASKERSCAAGGLLAQEPSSPLAQRRRHGARTKSATSGFYSSWLLVLHLMLTTANRVEERAQSPDQTESRGSLQSSHLCRPPPDFSLGLCQQEHETSWTYSSTTNQGKEPDTISTPTHLREGPSFNNPDCLHLATILHWNPLLYYVSRLPATSLHLPPLLDCR